MFILTSWRLTSNVNKLRKQVICKKKFISRATPAYKANNLTAGISVKAPIKVNIKQDKIMG